MPYNRKHANEEGMNMKNTLVKIIVGLGLCFAGFMLFVHRRLIAAAIMGEELPEAPKGCPAYRG